MTRDQLAAIESEILLRGGSVSRADWVSYHLELSGEKGALRDLEWGQVSCWATDALLAGVLFELRDWERDARTLLHAQKLNRTHRQEVSKQSKGAL